MKKRLEKLIGKSLTKIVKLFPKETLYKFVNSSKQEIELYQFSIGNWIMVNILVDQSPIYREFVKNGITRKDMMSLCLLEHLHDYFKAEM